MVKIAANHLVISLLQMNKEEFEKHLKYGVEDGGTIFVNFETDKGTFQLTAYNSHNGYYSHTAKFIVNEIVITETL